MHLLHVFPSFQLGGSQRRFATLANAFAGACRNSVIALDGQRTAATLLAPQTPYTAVEAPPRQAAWRAIPAARWLLRDLKPDCLVTYNWGAIEWAAADLPRLVRHVHIEDGFGPEEAGGQLKRRMWFRRLVLNRHSTVVLPSQTLVRLATDQWRIAPQRITYIPNGIPCGRFAQAPDGDLLARMKGHGPIIGTVATLRREKALERLIDAFGRIRADRPARLVIVGDGPERANLERHADATPFRADITFLGQVDQPERVMGTFDLFALSSDTEQMPLSILEAMAARCAIVSTAVGDVPSMVADNNRPFVAGRDADVLAAGMARLLADDGLRRTLGAANRARAISDYDESRMIAAYRRLFLETS